MTTSVEDRIRVRLWSRSDEYPRLVEAYRWHAGRRRQDEPAPFAALRNRRNFPLPRREPWLSGIPATLGLNQPESGDIGPLIVGDINESCHNKTLNSESTRVLELRSAGLWTLEEIHEVDLSAVVISQGTRKLSGAAWGPAV